MSHTAVLWLSSSLFLLFVFLSLTIHTATLWWFFSSVFNPLSLPWQPASNTSTWIFFPKLIFCSHLLLLLSHTIHRDFFTENVKVSTPQFSSALSSTLVSVNFYTRIFLYTIKNSLMPLVSLLSILEKESSKEKIIMYNFLSVYSRQCSFLRSQDVEYKM